MKTSLKHIKQILDQEVCKRNTQTELSALKPDPLLILHRYKDHEQLCKIALICALLSYGNAHNIIHYLSHLDFTVLDAKNPIQATDFKAYRFQTPTDIMMLITALRQIDLQAIFIEGISQKPMNPFPQILLGVFALQTEIYKHTCGYNSKGFNFLVGKAFSHSAFKRWNLFLRWAIRKDRLDLGFWQGILPPSQLLLPLDTHVASVCRSLDILRRKSNDLKAVLEATQTLSLFDPTDPIKYDFALYRIGQEKLLRNL